MCCAGGKKFNMLIVAIIGLHLIAAIGLAAYKHRSMYMPGRELEAAKQAMASAEAAAENRKKDVAGDELGESATAKKITEKENTS